jgi:hypothetical protein
MTKGMSMIKRLRPNERHIMKENFVKAMKTASQIFGNDAFRKRRNFYERRKPINKALFETLSVWIAKCTDDERKLLVTRKDILRERFIDLNNDDKFYYALSSGTGQKESVNYRHRKVRELIQSILS